jgi:hypothetical protein
MKKLLLSTTLAAALAMAALAHIADAAQPNQGDFSVTFSANGQVSGTLKDFELVDDIDVSIAGTVELHNLAPALLQNHVLRNDRSKRKEVWLDRIEIVGDELVVRGGGRYEDRQPLPFGGWTKLYSQSGSLEVRLRISAQNGVPVVTVSHVNVELGGLLGDVMNVFKLDDAIARIAHPIIQAEINAQIAANVPREIGKIGAIYIDDLAFVSMPDGRYGLRMAASATIDLN